MKSGDILADKYRIIEVLGKGGTSVVYLAENLVLNNFWAIKAVFRQSPWFTSEMQEISVLKGLSHPMLPRIADLIEDQDYCYIVMDYLSGTNLSAYIGAKGRIPEATLLKWAHDLLEVLSYLHSRMPPVIYRDLKPSNLIVDESGRLKLVDFGTAQLNREGQMEDTVYIGTQGYAAPEQYGSGRSDARTDLYNLGMTLVHMATGIHPAKINDGNIKCVLKQAGISSAMVRFILNLIQSDPDRRPQCCADAQKTLEGIIHPKPLFAGWFTQTRFESQFKSVIAVSSILPGTGVTSFCIMLGTFFVRQGLQVAIAELNSHGDFDGLKSMLIKAGELKHLTEEHFETQYLSFYPALTDSGQIPRKNLDVIILDLGVLKDDAGVRELNRADIQLILCPNVPWKYPRIGEFKERFKYQIQDTWVYALSTPQKNDEQFIKRMYKTDPLVSFSFPSNPFDITNEEERRIGRILKQIYYLSGQKVSF